MKKPAQWKVKRNVFLWDRTRQLLSFSAVLNSRIMSANFRCLPVPVYVSQFLYVSQFPYMSPNFRICLPVPVYVSQLPYTSPNFGIMSLNSRIYLISRICPPISAGLRWIRWRNPSFCKGRHSGISSGGKELI